MFKELIREGVLLVYMDDAIIASVDEKQHFVKLKKVLDTAAMNGLIIQWKNCKIMRKEVVFLGHIIGNGIIKPSSEKVSAIRNFPIPKNVKQVESFLGLAGFFRKFICNFSIIAKPLSDLRRNGVKFCFGPDQHNAFETLCQEPILKIFDPNLETSYGCKLGRIWCMFAPKTNRW